MTKKEKLKVYLRLPQVADCGVGYYRQWLPLKIAKEYGKLDFKCQNFTWGERGQGTKDPMPDPTDKEYLENGEWSNVMYYARNDVPQYIAQAGGMRDFFKETKGVYKPAILDIDDNVQATRPYNPGYRSFYPNSPCMTWNIKSFGVFDRITVSTQNLKEYYSDYTDKNKIFVCPNSLDWEERDAIYNMDFSKSKLFEKKEGEIRIGWSGSSAHWENLKHIEEPVLDILHKYPETTFYYSGLFGDLFNDKELIEAGRIKTIGWSGLEGWAKFNREVNFDIALAPIMDNMFNRAKSNLRILEYASAKYPVIASPVEPYNCFTKDEVLFAMEKEEWYDGIEKLIKDSSLREKLSKNLYKRAKKDYNIRVNYKYWVKALTPQK